LTSPVSTQTSCDEPVERRVGTVGRHLEIKIVAGIKGNDSLQAALAGTRA
jgi:hypothetical protein